MRSCMQAISIVIWAHFSFSCTLIIEIETFFANYPHSNHFPLMKLFNLFNKNAQMGHIYDGKIFIL